MPDPDYIEYAKSMAKKYNIPEDIFLRQINQESGFNPAAKSPAGATGIAQIMPQYHPDVDPNDPYASLEYAAKLNAGNFAKYGSWDKALAAYNAGGGAVDKYGGVPPFEETQRYIKSILGGLGEIFSPQKITSAPSVMRDFFFSQSPRQKPGRGFWDPQPSPSKLPNSIFQEEESSDPYDPLDFLSNFYGKSSWR